jgi:uncharacterized alpha-E superfamily protein
MARYIERADSLARMLHVDLGLLLELRSADADQLRRNWTHVVDRLGLISEFAQKSDDVSCDGVLSYLVFDPDNFHSLVACIRFARENARSVREQISADLWEQINRQYLWSTSSQAQSMFEKNPYDFFEKVKEDCLLVRGCSNDSMMQGEAWDFIQIGRMLERADKTSRLLDDRFHPLPKRYETLQWAAVMRGCSAIHAYQKTYRTGIKPRLVVDLLLLNDQFPRSIEFCVRKVDFALRRISGAGIGRYLTPAEKVSGHMLAELEFHDIDEHLADGLHACMDRVQTALNEIGLAVDATYVHACEQKQPVSIEKASASPLPQTEVSTANTQAQKAFS